MVLTLGASEAFFGEMGSGSIEPRSGSADEVRARGTSEDSRA